MFGEPPPTQADLHFSLFRIPIRVHPFFWLVTLLLNYSSLRDPIDVVTWIAAVFVSILVHELGHGLTMQAYGFQPWITLYGLGGVTSYDQRFAYRSKGSDALPQILISFAGPAAGFLLTAVIVVALVATGHKDAVFFGSPFGIRPFVLLENMRFAAFLNDIFFISVMWGLINLLPVYPLDGGQIVRELLLAVLPRDGLRLSLVISMFAGTGMAIYGFMQWQSIFVAIMFGYLAYMSFETLQAYSNRTPWQ